MLSVEWQGMWEDWGVEVVVLDQSTDPYLPGESTENHKKLQQKHTACDTRFFFILWHSQYLILYNVEV